MGEMNYSNPFEASENEYEEQVEQVSEQLYNTDMKEQSEVDNEAESPQVNEETEGCEDDQGSVEEAAKDEPLFTVNVDEPQKVGNALKQYMQFRVSFKGTLEGYRPQRWCYRRYTHFETLSKALE